MKRGSIDLARRLCVEIAGCTDEEANENGYDYGSVDIAEILSAEIERLRAECERLRGALGEIAAAKGFDNIGAWARNFARKAMRGCQCRQCLRDRNERDSLHFPVEMTRMIVCETCWNKRCPRSRWRGRSSCTATGLRRGSRSLARSFHGALWP